MDWVTEEGDDADAAAGDVVAIDEVLASAAAGKLVDGAGDADPDDGDDEEEDDEDEECGEEKKDEGSG